MVTKVMLRWTLKNMWRPLNLLFNDLGCKTCDVTYLGMLQSNKTKSYRGRCDYLSVSIVKWTLMAPAINVE